LLAAKSKDEFLKAKTNIHRRYTRYRQTGAPRLKILIATDLLPNPKNYPTNTQHPTNRMIIPKEQTLEHEFNTNNLNILKCDTCLECQIKVDVKEGQDTYTCQKCHNRKDPSYFLRNNLHPAWYEVDDESIERVEGKL
jgi:hypothetical protein